MKIDRYVGISVAVLQVCVAISAGQVARPPVSAQSGVKESGVVQSGAKESEIRTLPITGITIGAAAGAGSQGGIVQPNPQATVSTAQELAAALQVAANNRFRCDMPYVIWVEDNASIDLGTLANNADGAPNYLLQIPPCVTLASGRTATVDGGLLHLDTRLTVQQYALQMGNTSRVTGLRLQGPSGSSDANSVSNAAILIQGIGQALVDNNEIYNWPLAGVDVKGATNNKDSAQQIEVRGNFIHDNVMCGLGYGVVVGKGGYAYIDENLFDYNRHAVADDGCVAGQGSCIGNTGYLAMLNFVMSGGDTCPSSSILGNLAKYYNQHFDVHGLGGGCGSMEHCGGAAGEYFDIRYNSIRGDQTYDNFGIWGKTRPAFELRGTPVIGAYFRDNAVAHGNEGAAISTPAANPQPHLFVSNIQYGLDSSNQLAVGDFDGDGSADIFESTGQVWFYSPQGRREWRYLNQSSIQMNGLAFGDFDGDGKTDVFTQEGDKWLVSYGGTGPWTALPAGSNIPMSGYGFADFDGDGKTDIFESNGKEWFYSSGGATAWKHLNYSPLGIKDIRFGHFNPKDLKKADVFAIVNGEWAVSYGGTAPWERINGKLSDDISTLVFGDFNGDGITDIATGIGTPTTTTPGRSPGPPAPITWYVSWSGRGPWTPLLTFTPAAGEVIPPLSQMLIGDFNGDKHADVLTPIGGYFFWSSGGSTPLAQRSVYFMQ